MLTEVQKKLLDMLKWFHAFCAENQIAYYVLGGTLLGAVRHKGFIPWDDDIDIGLPREDYERLKQCTDGLPQDSRYILEVPSSEKDFDYLYCKLYDTHTTLAEHVRARTKRGLYLDIFPLDGIGNTYEESLKNYKGILTAINFYNTRVCALRKGRKLYKNLAILVSRCIPGIFYNKKKRAAKIDRMCASRPYNESVYVGNLLGNWGKREIVERAWMGVPTLYPFEDMQVYGPCDADKYLTAIYGDYMQLPPEEKRVSNHDYLYMDLNTPYAEYHGRKKK